MRVRPAAPGDAAAIRAVHAVAFPTVAEADLVQRLAADGDLAVSLVAEEDGAVIGHVAFSRMRVTADGTPVPALGLAPVAVLPARQRGGVGSALIEAGIADARADGAAILFVLGEPAYYGRFGFDAARAAPFDSPYAGPCFMALFLSGDGGVSAGRADYAPAFAELG